MQNSKDDLCVLLFVACTEHTEKQRLLSSLVKICSLWLHVPVVEGAAKEEMIIATVKMYSLLNRIVVYSNDNLCFKNVKMLYN